MFPPIVDMRNRPTWLHKFFGSTPGTAEFKTVQWLNKRVGSLDTDHFTRSANIGQFVSEMDSADISIGVQNALQALHDESRQTGEFAVPLSIPRTWYGHLSYRW